MREAATTSCSGRPAADDGTEHREEERQGGGRDDPEAMDTEREELTRHERREQKPHPQGCQHDERRENEKKQPSGKGPPVPRPGERHVRMARREYLHRSIVRGCPSFGQLSPTPASHTRP